ncbi:hemerythrin domain-containing protein [Azoarcus sp. DN11]|uniref:hemerythrin domain-containing protein n=1 Tax=Azoarcus sp. DN11 TaxID=356837 RepID=UPI000EB247B6|nr:hemerythrin domain-containing protein [Azoarcus sp. DN11]AYH43194.1 hemerythrin [Azoarcus sp. DN11]
MSQITSLMTDDHRSCDQTFARAETAAAKGKWDEASAAFEQFAAEMENHFDAEESLLFPKFEAATGMTEGPTKVMRGEHAEMRSALARMRDALANKDGDDYAGESETLLILMQQHNMKEENILYPMCDSHLGGSDVAAGLSERLHARA